MSYLITGVLLWGGLGYLGDRLLSTRPWLTVAGALIGNFAGIYLIYLRTVATPRRDRDAT